MLSATTAQPDWRSASGSVAPQCLASTTQPAATSTALGTMYRSLAVGALSLLDSRQSSAAKRSPASASALRCRQIGIVRAAHIIWCGCGTASRALKPGNYEHCVAHLTISSRYGVVWSAAGDGGVATPLLHDCELSQC